jgi:predicted transcriptional regulator
MEIVGDILRVINEGSARPTQVMHKANLTWPVLMTHFEALLRHQFLTRETSVSRTTYRLTARGSAVLGIYLKLKEELGSLESEAEATAAAVATFPRGIVGALEIASPPKEKKNATRSLMRSVLEGANFRLLDEPIPGRSGATYGYEVTASGLDRAVHGFDVLTHASESTVIRAFVKQLDSDIAVHLVYTKSASDVARKLAASYSIELVHAREFKRLVELLAFRDGLYSGDSLLLEVDPSQDYWSHLLALVEDQAKRSSHVSVFTWRGSPVYPVLPRNQMVSIHVMAPEPTGSHPLAPGESAVPSNDAAALLQALRRDSTPKGGALGKEEGEKEQGEKKKMEGAGGGLVVFESVSELVVSLGNESALRFLRKATSSLKADGRRSLFVLKRGYHDERGMRMIKSVFAARIVHDERGLRIDRSA